jgi:hypothetical protein
MVRTSARAPHLAWANTLGRHDPARSMLSHTEGEGGRKVKEGEGRKEGRKGGR